MKIKIYQNLKRGKIVVGIMFILLSFYMAFFVITGSTGLNIFILSGGALVLFITGLLMLLRMNKLSEEILEVEKYEVLE